MAVSSLLLTNKMSLKYRIGVDTNGKDVFKTQSFSISANATEEEMLDLTDRLERLIDHTVNATTNAKNFMLVRE